MGPEYSNYEIAKILKQKKLNSKFKVQFKKNDKEIIKIIVKGLEQKKIIGLFRGRLEWGARALGNRSIIADPRGRNIKNIINRKIKLRENFRPFAPSILYEHANKWFHFEKIKEISNMMHVLKFKKNVKSITPAIRHIDNTGRLQTVKKSDNEFFYKLLSFFFKKTRVPILLNTSFNVQEPIVCKPIDAINCFKNSKMDCLILENFIITRS